MRNLVFIDGNLTADPEIFGESQNVMRFTVASNTGSGDNRQTHFIDCVVLGQRFVDAYKEHLSKGINVSIRGQLVQDKWEKDGKTFSRLQVRIDRCSLGIKIPALAESKLY